jgi:hypothetical protein
VTTIRACVLAHLVGLAGFAGAQALASESPPLVANCVNAAEGWRVEVLGVDCTRAGQIIGSLTQRRPKGSARAKGMTCTVGYAGSIPVAIRCTASRGRFLRADAYLPGKAKAPALKLARCPDYVDKLKRRWIVRTEGFGCRDVRQILTELAASPTAQNDVKWTERAYNLSCGLWGNPLREIRCAGWHDSSPNPTDWGGFHAQVKLLSTPTPNPSTTTVRRR